MQAKGRRCGKKASVAEKAAEEARKAALEAGNVINKYENTAGAALRGCNGTFFRYCGKCHYPTTAIHR